MSNLNHFMRLYFSLVFIMCFSLISHGGFAQVPVQRSCGLATDTSTRPSIFTLGSGLASNGSPFRGAEVTGSRRQFIISRAELNALGFINGIIKGVAVNVRSNQPNVYRNFKVRMQCVDSAVATINQFYPAGTQVFAADSLDPARGWFNFAFAGNGYAWDGRGGIILEFCFFNTRAGNPVQDSVLGTAIDNQVWVGNTNDGSNPCASVAGGFTFAFKPNFRFSIVPSDSLPPTPVQRTCGTPVGVCPSPSSQVQPQTGATALAANPFRNKGVSGTRRQYIFSRAELNAAGFSNGIIKELSFRIKTNDTVRYRNFRLSMACGGNNDSTLSGFSNVSTVVFASSILSPDNGWVTFPFAGEGFAWAGNGALLVETCFSNPSNGTREDTLYSTQTLGRTKVWGANTTNGATACGSNSGTFGFDIRPLTRFGVCKAGSLVGISQIVPGTAPTLFPNPTAGQFQITGLPLPYSLQVYSISGGLLLSKTISQANHTSTIGQPGLYFIRTQANGRNHTFKLQVLK